MENFAKCFSRKTRTNGESFYHIQDECKKFDELKELSYQIHCNHFFNCLPDDWIYEQIYYAFEVLAECEREKDFERSRDEIEPNPYTRDLLKWAQAGYAQEYIQEAIDSTNPQSLSLIISVAQVSAIENIYCSVWDFLKENSEVYV